MTKKQGFFYRKRRRLIVLSSAFLVLFVSNFYLLFKYIDVLQVQASQSRLLAELNELSTDNLQQEPSHPLVLGVLESDVKLVDGRVAALKRYLRKLDSPLFDYSELLVEEADKNGYDYRLLVAIALQESTGCKRIPHGSHNCWGWGIYGDTVTRFDSYEHAIVTVSDGIKKNYIDKGFITTESIMSKYTPSSDGSWAWGIRFFFQKIDSS